MDQHINPFRGHGLRERLELRGVADVEGVNHHFSTDGAESARLRRRAGSGVHPPSGSGVLPRQLQPDATARPNNQRGWHVALPEWCDLPPIGGILPVLLVDTRWVGTS
jgi:hypothetical protein